VDIECPPVLWPANQSFPGLRRYRYNPACDMVT